MPPSQDFLKEARSKFTVMTRSERLQAAGFVGLERMDHPKTGSANPKLNTVIKTAQKREASQAKSAKARALVGSAMFGGEFVADKGDEVGGDGDGAERAGVRKLSTSERGIEDASEDRILIDDLVPATGWR